MCVFPAGRAASYSCSLKYSPLAAAVPTRTSISIVHCWFAVVLTAKAGKTAPIVVSPLESCQACSVAFQERPSVVPYACTGPAIFPGIPSIPITP